MMLYSLKYTPKKRTWNPKLEVWKMIFLFKWMIFRFYVSFQGSTCHSEMSEEKGPESLRGISWLFSESVQSQITLIKQREGSVML